MTFNLFKSKPTLRELIPKGFVDIHSHILPGVDDGPKTVEESLKLISKMKEMGFTKIIGTPHTYPGLYDNTNKTIRKSFENLNKINDTGVEIGYSSEYLINRNILKEISEKSILTIDNNYVLIEMGFVNEPGELFEIIFQLMLNDYTPILAHPERYLFYYDNFKIYYKLKKHGCKFQINLLSAVGYYGKRVANLCEKLFDEGLVDYVGSDIHNENHIKYFNKKIKINSKNLELAIENNQIFNN